MKRAWLHSLWKIIRNKYLIVFLTFMVWMTLFDQHNLIDRYKTRKHLTQLKKDTNFYIEQIKKDEDFIRQLQTDPQNLEKFAREQYLMKAPDEDIFVILKRSENK